MALTRFRNIRKCSLSFTPRDRSRRLQVILQVRQEEIPELKEGEIWVTTKAIADREGQSRQSEPPVSPKKHGISTRVRFQEIPDRGATQSGAEQQDTQKISDIQHGVLAGSARRKTTGTADNC